MEPLNLETIGVVLLVAGFLIALILGVVIWILFRRNKSKGVETGNDKTQPSKSRSQSGEEDWAGFAGGMRNMPELKTPI